MEQRKKYLQVIDNNSVLFLTKVVIDDTFIAHLREKHILQVHEIDDLSEKSGRQRNTYFLQKLRKGPQRAFDNLLEIFKDVGHPEIASRLSEGYHVPKKDLSKEQVNRIRTILHPLVLNKKLSMENQANLLKTVVARTDYDRIMQRLIFMSEELEDFKNQVEIKEKQIVNLTKALHLRDSEHQEECNQLLLQIQDLEKFKVTLLKNMSEHQASSTKNLHAIRQELAKKDAKLKISEAKIFALEKEKEHISRELANALETIPKADWEPETRRMAQEHEDISETENIIKTENISDRLQELTSEIQAYADGVKTTSHEQEQLKKAANAVFTTLEEAQRKNTELQHLATKIENAMSSHALAKTNLTNPSSESWVKAQVTNPPHETWLKAPQVEENLARVSRHEVMLHHFEVGECKVDALSVSSNTTETKSTHSSDSSVYEDCVEFDEDPNASNAHICSSNKECLSKEISKPSSYHNKAHASQSSSNARHHHNAQRRSSHDSKQKHHTKRGSKTNISLELNVRCSSICNANGNIVHPPCDSYENPGEKHGVAEVRLDNRSTVTPCCNTKNYIHQNKLLQRRPPTSRNFPGYEKHPVRQHQFDFPGVPRKSNYVNMRRNYPFPGFSYE